MPMLRLLGRHGQAQILGKHDFISDGDFTAGGNFQAGNAPERRRLAAAAGSEQRKQLPRRNCE